MTLNSRLAFAMALASASLLATACRPTYPKCKTDEHCAEKAEVCVEGLCKECSTDTHCKEGFTCRENACTALPQCRLDKDCGEGLRCRSERCVPECTTERECASGEKCANNRCRPADECASEADCAGGKSCKAGRCEVSDAAQTGAAQTAEEAEAARRRAALEACVLEALTFDFNEFALSDLARASLDRSADCARFRQKSLVIGGHADERGTEEYNIVLAEKRANTVKRYLVGLGLEEGKIKTVSFGEEQPIAQGHDEAAWTRNRRAELNFR